VRNAKSAFLPPLFSDADLETLGVGTRVREGVGGPSNPLPFQETLMQFVLKLKTLALWYFKGEILRAITIKKISQKILPHAPPSSVCYLLSVI
jgi:hypothetical protein